MRACHGKRNSYSTDNRIINMLRVMSRVPSSSSAHSRQQRKYLPKVIALPLYALRTERSTKTSASLVRVGETWEPRAPLVKH